MSRGLPDQFDIWRLVAGRRCFSGSLRLAELVRLRESLAQPDGEVEYSLEFDVDELEQAYAELLVQGGLPLLCQRTLETYRQPVSIRMRLGLIRREEQEAALPPGYEPFLVPADGMVSLAELIEDELILALPLVPVRTGSGGTADEGSEEPEQAPGDETRPNPFAVLKGLRLQ